jgi:hypothetical protein
MGQLGQKGVDGVDGVDGVTGAPGLAGANVFLFLSLTVEYLLVINNP